MTARPKSIIAAVEPGDELSGDVVKTAKMLAETFDASLTLITVAPPVIVTPPVAPDVAAYPVETPTGEELREQERRRAEDALNTFAREHKCLNNARRVLVGRAKEEICRFAEKTRADLLVIGAHRRGWLEKLFSPSVSKSVAERSPCAVYLVPEREGDARAS